MKNVTELVIIIDKSGSMYDLAKDVVGGFNSLIEEQKKTGDTIVTTIFFNDKVQFVHEGVDIKDIKPLDNRTYCPGGCTALLDAIGNAIGYIKEKHAKLKINELPEHTFFSIMTDGLENASREYNYKQVKSMIELQKKSGWEFIFQAANIDTEYEASKLGIDQDTAFSFEATKEGLDGMFFCCSQKINDIKEKKAKKK